MPTPPSPRGELNVVAGPGRFRGESRVVLSGAGGARAHGLWFDGSRGGGVRSWVDLHDADPRLLAPVARVLGPGGAIMVAYGHGETERALRRKVPPAATPLGLELLRAGCCWLKDWYFAEGGREGHAKLQGELPIDDGHRCRAERALRGELEWFLTSGRGSACDDDRARQALRVLGEPG